MKSALHESVQSVLECPDWFQERLESSAMLKPLLEERNSLYTKWLKTRRESDRKKFGEMRRNAR